MLRSTLTCPFLLLLLLFFFDKGMKLVLRRSGGSEKFERISFIPYQQRVKTISVA
jgi:hypothetical protein